MFPPVAPAGKETEIEVVPCPLTIVAPAGTVHIAADTFVNPATEQVFVEGRQTVVNPAIEPVPVMGAI